MHNVERIILGETQKGTDANGSVIRRELLGTAWEDEALDPSISTIRGGRGPLTPRKRTLQPFRNVAGSALLGGRFAVRDTAGDNSETYPVELQLSGYASGRSSRGLVVLDPYIPAAGVADNDIVNGILKGDVPLTLPGASAFLGSIAKGDLIGSGANGLAVRLTRAQVIDLTRFRVHDAIASNLPAAAGTDDLGFVSATGATIGGLQAGDFGGTSVTQKGTVHLRIPDDYKDGAYLALVFTAGMLTTVSDGTATLDLAAYAASAGVTAGSDINATPAQSINSLTLADHTFVITPTGLVAGQALDVVVTIAGSDTGDAGAMIPVVTALNLVYGTNVPIQGEPVVVAQEAKTTADADGTVLVSIR